MEEKKLNSKGQEIVDNLADTSARLARIEAELEVEKKQ
jgi:hypothetical protein